MTRYQDMLEAVNCNLCGADDFTIVRPPDYVAAVAVRLEDVFRSSGDDALFDRLVRCRCCGLEYLNPRLRGEIVIESYSAGTDEVFVSQQEARRRTFQRCWHSLRRHIPARGRVLDIGAAAGAFLSVARDAGWDVIGCEPNEWMAGLARSQYGVDVRAGTLSDLGLPAGGLDLVTLWDVLEHTPDPAAVLRECRRVLAEGGLLAINYPDIGSLPARVMGSRWVFLLSVHLYYFRAATIDRLLQRCGFEAIESSRHWQWLELGYILTRAEHFAPLLIRPMREVARMVGLNSVEVPYWMGQTLVLARARPASAVAESK